jgi:hypothetical protein
MQASAAEIAASVEGVRNTRKDAFDGRFIR